MTTVDEAREALLRLMPDTPTLARHGVDALIAAVRAERPTSCPGCGHHWWTVGDDAYGCESAEALRALREAGLDALALAGLLNDHMKSRDLLPYYTNIADTNIPKLRKRLAATPAEDASGFVRCPLCHDPERVEDMVGGVCLTCADGIAFAQNARRGAIEVAATPTEDEEGRT